MLESFRGLAHEQRQLWLDTLWSRKDLAEHATEHLWQRAKVEAWEDLADINWQTYQEYLGNEVNDE